MLWCCCRVLWHTLHLCTQYHINWIKNVIWTNQQYCVCHSWLSPVHFGALCLSHVALSPAHSHSLLGSMLSKHIRVHIIIASQFDMSEEIVCGFAFALYIHIYIWFELIGMGKNLLIFENMVYIDQTLLHTHTHENTLQFQRPCQFKFVLDVL